MSGWDLATWLSIAVLTVGAGAVFVWFLRDVLRMGRRNR